MNSHSTALELQSLCLVSTMSIRQAIASIDRNNCGIALVVNEERHLLGTVTDGDIRRAMLANIDLDSPISVILERKVNSPYPQPVTAPITTSPEVLLQL